MSSLVFRPVDRATDVRNDFHPRVVAISDRIDTDLRYSRLYTLGSRVWLHHRFDDGALGLCACRRV